jgi:hypothetical protein
MAGALTVPNWTLTLPEKPVPVIVTMAPPTAVPLAGDIPVTVGGEMKLNLSAVPMAEGPARLTTVTSTMPGLPAGLVAVIWVSDTTVMAGALTVPNWTLAAPRNPLPVIVTLFPPAAVPTAGEIPVTTAGTAV